MRSNLKIRRTETLSLTVLILIGYLTASAVKTLPTFTNQSFARTPLTWISLTNVNSVMSVALAVFLITQAASSIALTVRIVTTAGIASAVSIASAAPI